MKKEIRSLFISFLFISIATISFSQNGNILVVNADKPVSKIQPTLWGLFFEDINFAADGGIYAELVKNRSFEFSKPTDGWVVEGSNFLNSPLQIINRGDEFTNNPRIAQISVKEKACILNKGFRGMGIVETTNTVFPSYLQ